ncbi:MAG: thiamine pyrophosphate-dependent enzyme [Methanomassiliicoccales archaeon]|nr:thiamine pyrophosphate-dependent enzyme [Methanomassiliicoccales archaeon]
MVTKEIKTIKDLPRDDYLTRGHGACPGCGVAIAVKNIARVLGKDTIVYVPACCLIVFSALYPASAFKWPFFYTAFENTGAVISGIKAALKRCGKEVTVVGMAGDGGTFDIGLQALSGAAERNEDVIYVCLDNEAYMNTGIQRSGATPFGAWTTTSPIGKKVQGKREFKKDIDVIVAAHNIPYMATLSIAHPNDFVRKVQKAKSERGFRFLHVLCPCVPGWRSEASKSVTIARLAVETGMWILYEVDHGIEKLTYKPKTLVPVKEYLQLQGRFRHMSEEDVEKLQTWICERWKHQFYEEVPVPPCKIEEAKKTLIIDEDPLHGP